MDVNNDCNNDNVKNIYIVVMNMMVTRYRRII